MFDINDANKQLVDYLAKKCIMFTPFREDLSISGLMVTCLAFKNADDK